jgi:hypothetical protein
MNSCKLGLHKWAYSNEGESRWCENCRKKQEKDDSGKWVDYHPQKQLVEEDANFCQCPRDYTISLKLRACPHCGKLRRPHILPSQPR